MRLKSRFEDITEQDKRELFPLIDQLIDAWCVRRALGPLRTLLPAYPLSNPLTDGWSALHDALRDLEDGPSELLADEREHVRYARRIVQFILDRK